MPARKRPRFSPDVPVVHAKLYDQLDADDLDREPEDLPEVLPTAVRVDYANELAAIGDIEITSDIEIASDTEIETEARDHQEEYEPLDLYELWSLHFELSARHRA